MNLWTENEARQKICPYLPVDRVSEDADGRTFDRVLRNSNCLASGCMMWRKADQIGITPEGKKVDRDMDGRTRWVDRGCCGLAGTCKGGE